jgi:hypothetical protein
MSTKRNRMITVAAAGALTLAAAISATAATFPSSLSGPSTTPAAAGATAATLTVDHVHLQQAQAQAAGGDSVNAAQQLNLFDEVRSSFGKLQHEYQVAAAKTASVKLATQTQPRKQSTVPTASGTPQQIAQQMLSRYGWSASQFSCLQPLWYHESGWNTTAENPSSGAYGIPQALPSAQLASAGADWRTNPATQIKWGLTYIQGRYGSPCGAWAHEQADNWY